MDIPGICSQCGRAGVMFTCRLCGRLVCSSCYDHVNHICKGCAKR